MSNDLWQIVIKETFLSWDVILLIILPVITGIVIFLFYKKSPLKSTNAWLNVGKRYMMLGAMISIVAFIVYLLSILIAYSDRDKANIAYTNGLQTKFRDYYSAKKNYTQRLIDFAQRIESHKDVLAEMDNFATNLPRDEREKLGRTWSASRHGGGLIQSGSTFNGLEEKLYWPEDKVEKYKKQNGGKSPGVAELRYTKEQIIEFKKSNWAKLYPMLDPEQWIFIKNQILNIEGRDSTMGFLRDIADCFQTPNPTTTLNALYERLADKACPTDLEKIECYLEDCPQLLSFYKFSLNNRWWFRSIAIMLIYLIVGVIIVFQGNQIVTAGKRKLFK